MVVQAEEQGGGLGGWGHQQHQDEDEDGGGGGGGFGFGFHESSSGSEFSRSSSENLKGGLLRLRRARQVGGGGSKKKKKRKTTAMAAAVGKDAAAASESPVSADERPESGRKKRREMESPVPWTEDMVRFLFETYDDVHRRLWIESRGKVKNQKKWDPIIRTMQDKFGRDFTKNQCESKYWKVRRECARFKSKTSAVMAEPHASPSGGGGGGGGGKPAGGGGGMSSSRDVVKPKFYDVWLEVAGNDPVKLPDIDVSSGSGEDDDGMPSPGCVASLADQDEYASPFRTTGPWDAAATATATAAAAGSNAGGSGAGGGGAGGGGGSTSTVREMKQFLSSHHEASEKREEDLSFKAGATLEAVRDHMTRMKRRGSMLDIAGKAQLSVLQGVENKLDRLLHGLTALNGNIGAMVGRLATLPQR